MRRLGKILHLSKSRSLIVQLESDVKVALGTKVVDSSLRTIGEITDLFGPVARAYVAVRPAVANPSKYPGRIAYSAV